MNGHDTRPARWLIAAAVLALTGAAIVAAPAAANPIPGATYNGSIAGDGAIALTVSPDGAGIASADTPGPLPGGGCWMELLSPTSFSPPLPIVNNAFSGSTKRGVYLEVTLTGSFTGPQSAAGTVRVEDDTPFTPGCDTGTLSWSAVTTAAPPAPPAPVKAAPDCAKAEAALASARRAARTARKRVRMARRRLAKAKGAARVRARRTLKRAVKQKRRAAKRLATAKRQAAAC